MQRRFFLSALTLALALAFPFAAAAQEYQGVVAFGDSLSDMGNRWIKSSADKGKMRNSWVRQLCAPGMLNYPEFMVSGMSGYLGGTNYAVGGATTEVTAAQNSERNRGQHLTQQVTKRYLNPSFNTDGVKPEALHVMLIGANDIMLASISGDQLMTKWEKLGDKAAAIARSTEGQIDALAKAGVKHVLWGNIFDLAQAPSVVKRAALAGAHTTTYLTAITKAVQAYNTEMDAAMVRLEQAHPGLQIIKMDLYTQFNEVAADPAKYGFIELTKGANDDKHLFSADGLHPTPKGHKMLAEFAYGVIQRSQKAPAKP